MACSMIIDAVLTFHNLLLYIYFLFVYVCMWIFAPEYLGACGSQRCSPTGTELTWGCGPLDKGAGNQTQVLVLNC